jgi:hypothetical protein
MAMLGQAPFIAAGKSHKAHATCHKAKANWAHPRRGCLENSRILTVRSSEKEKKQEKVFPLCLCAPFFVAIPIRLADDRCRSLSSVL